MSLLNLTAFVERIRFMNAFYFGWNFIILLKGYRDLI